MMKPSRTKPPTKTKPRRRRSAEDARAAILDAAERRLVAAGPAGIRLQDVAAEVGVAHPTVLHHFGSREALVREVCERRYAALRLDLQAAMAASSGGREWVASMVESVAKAVGENGHARVFFWLALEGMIKPGAEPPRMRALADAAQALRTRRRKGRPAPLEDTLHLLALSSLVLLAEAVLGPSILADLGLGATEAARARFRAWLAKVLAQHLESGG
jgi:AcrR family transcriptional regulator